MSSKPSIITTAALVANLVLRCIAIGSPGSSKDPEDEYAVHVVSSPEFPELSAASLLTANNGVSCYYSNGKGGEDWEAFTFSLARGKAAQTEDVICPQTPEDKRCRIQLENAIKEDTEMIAEAKKIVGEWKAAMK
ncbi:hypothetical protein FOZ62_025040 [Perkinsus olseni]|uniref:Uncharacterized protein n=1 Tax=Perkinsus olseni TaxID=32597 RepID=A0A7J6QM53_PEROL|nr:hypothetical protein FOZ62_025040 [Perkinsus olseni]